MPMHSEQPKITSVWQ